MSTTEAATELGPLLLAIARHAIAQALGLAAPVPDQADPRLRERGATFVTLTLDGELRGCIGSLNAHRPLGQDVRENALAAAFQDPRFAPLGADEWPRTRVEVSLLSRPEFMDFKDQAEVLARLRPGVDGVIFFAGCQKATFLPQVWEQLPHPREFMAALKRKAGKSPEYWGADVMIATYQVEKWKEAEPR
ncbi:MAG: AmmeMemoRadiSam system protein A [Rhodocyclaceae bacterium]|jgi:AmmeMemoRadiSam system protein A|nr:AmmeMemoRadiSam system protein A [Rhodocyclaceae bacterium]